MNPVQQQSDPFVELAKRAAKQPAKKTFTPVSTQCAVEVIEANTVTEGGIFVTNRSSGQLQTARGRVVAVGPKVEQVKEGDIVLFSSHLELIRHKGWELLMVNEVQIAGIELPDAEQNRARRE